MILQKCAHFLEKKTKIQNNQVTIPRSHFRKDTKPEIKSSSLGAPGWRSRLSVRLQPGHDLAVCEFEPRVRLWADGSEPGACFWFCVSLSLCPSPVHALSFSVPKIKNKRWKKKLKKKSSSFNNGAYPFLFISFFSMHCKNWALCQVSCFTCRVKQLVPSFPSIHGQPDTVST